MKTLSQHFPLKSNLCSCCPIKWTAKRDIDRDIGLRDLEEEVEDDFFLVKSAHLSCRCMSDMNSNEASSIAICSALNSDLLVQSGQATKNTHSHNK